MHLVKLNREVILYGPLEYDHWVLIEMDPLVQIIVKNHWRLIMHIWKARLLGFALCENRNSYLSVSLNYGGE